MSASIVELMELYDEYMLEQQQISRERYAHGQKLEAGVDSFGGFIEWLKRRVNK